MAGDSSTPENTLETDARRAQLVAAAEAARAWARERRASWSDPPAVTLLAPTLMPAVRPPVAVAPAAELVPVAVTARVATPAPAAPPTPVAIAMPAPVAVPVTMTAPVVMPVPVAMPAPVAMPVPAALEPPMTAAPSQATVESYDAEIDNPPSLLAPSDDEAPEEISDTASHPTARVGPPLGAYGVSLARWSKPVAVAAAVLVMLAGLGWAAQSYVRHRALPPRIGTIVLESAPSGSDVLVDGLPAGKTPTSREVPPGRHVIEFRRRTATRTINVNVAAGRSALGRLDWNVKRMGRLRVESYPPGATVNVDGRDLGVTPLTVDEVAEGPHAVILKSASGSVRRTVAITAGQLSEVSETIYAGWLAISTPIEVATTENGRPLEIDDHNQFRLTPGSHEVQLENKSLGYREVRRIDIKPGELTRISVVPRPSSITITATLPATVVIDDQRAGDTPVTGYPVNLGTREVIVRAASGAERRFTVAVTSTPARLDVDFSRP